MRERKLKSDQEKTTNGRHHEVGIDAPWGENMWCMTTAYTRKYRKESQKMKKRNMRQRKKLNTSTEENGKITARKVEGE